VNEAFAAIAGLKSYHYIGRLEKGTLTMTELENLNELVSRIEKIPERGEGELETIAAEIKQLPPEELEMARMAIGDYGPPPEPRKLGGESPGMVTGPVGTPTGNRFYVWSRLQ